MTNKITKLLQLGNIFLGALLLLVAYTSAVAKVKTTTKVLVLSDLHIPFQCERSLKVVQDFKKDFNPEITIILGDFIDCAAASSFAHDISPIDQLDEYDLANDWLDKLTKPGDIFVEGNHEERFTRKGRIPQDYRRLCEPRRWLNIHKRGLKWFPYSSYDREIFKLGKLKFVHGVHHGVTAAAKAAQQFGCVVFGHSHRVAMGQAPHASYKSTSFNIGCLCDLEPDYMRARPPTGWCNGFGFGYIYKSGDFSFQIARLINNQFHINGKEYFREA